jgi:hypothetical protein
MSQTLMHPLIASSVTNLLAVMARFGCAPKYWPRACYLLLATLVRQPLIWLETVRYGRHIERQVIEPAPLFIIGHWRSGTTHLQNLMSRDPQFGRVSLFQAAMPHEFLSVPGSVRERLGRMLPEKRLMDNVPVAADVPWEEELALTAVGPLSFYHVSFFPHAMERVFNEAVMFDGGDADLVARWKRQYLHFLRKVQFVQPGMRLLLKNPANTARVSLLRDMFPGAQFIHIHRDPYKVFASSVHLYTRAQEAWGLQGTDRDRVARHILDSYPRLMHAFFEQREGLGEGDLVDISFRSLQEDPIGTLQAVYQQLNLDGFDAALPHFEDYLRTQRHYEKNHLRLRPGEREEVARRWEDVFERLGYET